MVFSLHRLQLCVAKDTQNARDVQKMLFNHCLFIQIATYGHGFLYN